MCIGGKRRCNKMRLNTLFVYREYTTCVILTAICVLSRVSLKCAACLAPKRKPSGRAVLRETSNQQP